MLELRFAICQVRLAVGFLLDGTPLRNEYRNSQV
jgi:hypothetical protein